MRGYHEQQQHRVATDDLLSNAILHRDAVPSISIHHGDVILEMPSLNPTDGHKILSAYYYY